MKVSDLYSPTSIRDGNNMTWLSQEYEQVCRNRSSIRERDSVYHLRTNFKNAIPNSSPNYPQYRFHKGWLLSWNHFIFITRVTTFKCFKMQVSINLTSVPLSNRKVIFYTCEILIFLKKNMPRKMFKRALPSH